MYKTIRHGENSLQYTILPQTDDFRTNPIDSETATHERRIRTKLRKTKSSLLAYIGLFFVCSVVTGAIVVPLLVTTDIMPSPIGLFYKGDGISNNLKGKSIASPPSYHPKIIAYKRNNTEKLKMASSTTTTTTTSTTTAAPATVNNVRNSSTSNYYATIIKPIAASTQLTAEPTEALTTSTSSTTPEAPVMPIADVTKAIFLNYSFDQAQPVGDNRLGASRIEVHSSATTTQAPEIPVTSAAATIIQVNVIQPDGVEIESTNQAEELQRILKPNTNNSTRMKSATDDKNSWFKTHLPFFEFSTYLWAGYDSEDSIILPIVLCTALIIVVLIIALCIFARNRKSFMNSIWIRKRSKDPFGRNSTSDIQGTDDNTTLLVDNENGSEEE